MKQFEYDLELEDEEGPQFNNLVVDEITGSVYLGGQNRLYQLTPNLEMKVSKIKLMSIPAGHTLLFGCY